MDQQTDLELPDDFFRTDNGQRGEKIAKNFARTSVRGVGGMRGARKILYAAFRESRHQWRMLLVTTQLHSVDELPCFGKKTKGGYMF